MDWQIAIDRNREALLSIIVVLMPMLGLVKGGREWWRFADLSP